MGDAFWLPICVLFAVTMLLSGCGGRVVPAPVVERAAAPSRLIKHHIVSRGETLYSIAWRYGMDPSKLGAANGIGPPYRLYPGQRLALQERAAAPAASGNGGAASRHGERPVAAKERRSGASAKAGARAQASSRMPPATLSAPWQWPANGAIERQFRRAPREHKGIDIRGELGEPVFAANSGTVVYAGHGLVGYGNLLIIRHSERYLSAYAHNSVLLVGEGQTVKVGERIAEIGDSGTDSVRLHFEVRRDGKPVDPLELLPRR